MTKVHCFSLVLISCCSARLLTRQNNALVSERTTTTKNDVVHLWMDAFFVRIDRRVWCGRSARCGIAWWKIPWLWIDGYKRRQMKRHIFTFFLKVTSGSLREPVLRRGFRYVRVLYCNATWNGALSHALQVDSYSGLNWPTIDIVHVYYFFAYLYMAATSMWQNYNNNNGNARTHR